MKQFKSIPGVKDNILEMSIESNVEMNLTSESNIYVCFDGSATILCEGTLAECYAYSREFERYNEYGCFIYSREAYDEMIKTFNDTINKLDNEKLCR